MNTPRPLIALLAAILLIGGCKASEPKSAPMVSPRSGTPSALNATFFEKPDIAYWQQRFETESRETFDRREEILRTIGLQPGQVVADIGTGTGFYAFLFAREVGPTGRVYAEDVVPAFVDHAREYAERTGLPVVPVLGTFDDVSLPPSSVDVAFICDTYHHFDDPHRVMRSIHRALKPTGQVIVIDFMRIPGVSSEWLLKHVRADEATFTREIEESGFYRMEEPRYLKENYFLRFGKVQ